MSKNGNQDVPAATQAFNTKAPSATGKIKYIMPAEDWKAVYAEEDETGELKCVKKPVVCFALYEYSPLQVRSNDLLQVRSMSADAFGQITFDDLQDGFFGLSGPDDETDWDEVMKEEFEGSANTDNEEEGTKSNAAPKSIGERVLSAQGKD